MKNFFIKYKHCWTLLYVFIYMPWFVFLEGHVKHYTIIHCSLDDKIPFCEYFVIPYFLWFLFVALTMTYLLFYSVDEFYKASAFLFIGMTVFLIISTVFPNGLNLRTDISGRDNICARIVSNLYKTDTSTNVFPSVHVFNTLGCMIALFKSKALKGHNIIKTFIFILSVSIILSTVFLKQHSVIDVIGGFVLAIIMYVLVYVIKWRKK